MDARDLIDLSRYPIDRVGGAECAAMIDRLRGDLAARGCVVLKGFVTPAGLAQLVAEAESVAGHGHASHSRTNAWAPL